MTQYETGREASAIAESEDEQAELGRIANRPAEIPWQGWKDILKRVYRNFGLHNVSLLAAGVAMFGLLAIFPALSVVVTLYGLFASPGDVINHIQSVEQLFPDQATEIIIGQLSQTAEESSRTLNFTLLVSVLFGFWSARRGIMSMIVACNVAYSEREGRNFLKLLGVSLFFTIVGIIGFVLLALMLVVLPLIVQAMPFAFPPGVMSAFALLRWPLLAVLFALFLQLVYRYAPCRQHARWQWVSWGAVVSTLLWILVSVLFSQYVQRFGNFGETYGTIGGVVILILWFYLSAVVVILGAELNAEIEHQSAMDSTTGEPRELGQRGAYVADTLGEHS